MQGNELRVLHHAETEVLTSASGTSLSNFSRKFLLYDSTRATSTFEVAQDKTVVLCFSLLDCLAWQDESRCEATSASFRILNPMRVHT